MVATWPFQQWGLDFIGKIHPPSSGQHKWIFTATYYFTKWIEFIPTRSDSHKVIIGFLEYIIGRFGSLKRIFTDNDASNSSYPCKHIHIQQNLQRAQTCTVAMSSWSEGQGCLAIVFCSFSFYFFMHCNLRGGFFPMSFSLFPRLFQCIFCIWVPNMAS